MSKAVHVVVPIYANTYVDITPTMTSNTSPEGYVASASSEIDEPRKAWNAFDSIDSVGGDDGLKDRWHSSSGMPQWLMLKFPEPKKVVRFSVLNCASYHPGINKFSLQGSNDGGVFDTLGTYTNPSDMGALTEYDVSTPGEYQYYRLYIESAHCIVTSKYYAVIDQLRFYEDGGGTIVSTVCNTFGMYGVIQGKTKEITKGYAVVSGLARQFYSADVFGGYTGEYEVSQVTGTDGKLYDLYTLKKSGTLTLLDGADAQVWLCGGGARGGGEKGSTVAIGGWGGGGGYVNSGSLTSGEYVVTIGSGGTSTAGGKTTISSYSAAGGGSKSNQADGGSGGGAGGTSSGSSGGTGAGVSTYPFGITSLYAHCAGGGGGRNYQNATSGYNGGAGGSNGGSGSASTRALGVAAAVGAGGWRGGGTGGGQAATFYGGGGGGGSGAGEFSAGVGAQAGGNGYQGVVYVAIPA